MIRDSKNAGGLMVNSTYSAPWWLPGGSLQTIYARSLAKNYQIDYRRERWETPDGDFIDLDWSESGGDGSTLLVLFHGLEGCSRSHYALSVMAAAGQRGWRGVVPHFRGCSGEVNRLPRLYHSGDSEEINWVLRRLKKENPRSKLYVVGVSLGGNMLLKWLGEQASDAVNLVSGAIAVSAPVDLKAAAGALDFGYRKAMFTHHFIQSIANKVVAKIALHSLQIEPEAVRACSTFRQIDDLYTAPVHGFKDADDYWTRSSSKPWLKHVEVPTLLINARNDPFLPALALPTEAEVSKSITVELPASGGHVGFVTGGFPGNLDWLPQRIVNFLVP